jgi:outer membrane protein assembly factor BamB
VVTDSGVFVLTRGAELLRLGSVRAQRIAAVGGAATESLTVTANGALIGTLDGRLTFVRHDGTRVWEERFEGSIRAPAAVHRSVVYVGTLTGRLIKLIPD